MQINFDEILFELSYRVGIVDLTKEWQVMELTNILKENGVQNATELANKARVYFSYLKEADEKMPVDKIMDKTVTNTKTGNKIKVSTALSYKDSDDLGQQSAYQQAVAMFGDYGYNEKDIPKADSGDSEEPKIKGQSVFGKGKGADVFAPKDKETENPDTDIKIDSTLKDLFDSFEDTKSNAISKANVQQAIKSAIGQLNTFSKSKGNPYSSDHKKIGELLTSLTKGNKLSSTDKKFISKYVRVAEPTDTNPNSCKIYIAREPENFTSQGPKKRERIYVGSKDKSTPVIGAFRQFLEKNGAAILSTSTFGGKKTTANQTYIDENGKTRVLKNATSVKTSKDGKVESVKIGELNIVRMDSSKAKNDYEKKVIEKNNRLLEEYAEKINANDMDFIDLDKGVIPDNPKNRVIVIKEAINGMASNLTKLADKASVGDKETRALIKEMEDYSKLDPNKEPEKWLAGFENLLSRIANHDGEPSLKEAWANYAEIFVAIREMHDNGNGTENGKCALLPQSTTLETVDVITISDGKGDNRIVTLDGRSVKKGVGGASALTSKCRKSTYKNDPKGLIKKGVIELSESHNKPYELSMDEPAVKHKRLNDEYQKYLKEKAKQLRVDEEFLSTLEKDINTKGGKGYSKIESAFNNILLERKKAGLDVSKDSMEKIKMRLKSYYMYSEISHEAYNKNVDVQDFANDSVLSQKEDRGGALLAREGKIAIDRSDGIKILAYPKAEFNIGFTIEGKSRNPGSGRFHNQPKRA